MTCISVRSRGSYLQLQIFEYHNSAAVSFVELQMLLFTSKNCRAKTNSDGAVVCCDEVTRLLARLLQMKNPSVYPLVSSFFTTSPSSQQFNHQLASEYWKLLQT